MHIRENIHFLLKHIGLTCLGLWLSILNNGHALAVDIYQADKLFSEQKYAEAFAEYQKSAEIGNPHAHFRLGGMYAKGLGTNTDNVNSLLHFYIASELEHKQASKISEQIFASYSPDERKNIVKLLQAQKQYLDVKQVKQKYLPEPVRDFSNKQKSKSTSFFGA